MPGASLLIRNGRPHGKAAADVLVIDGVIAAIGPALAAPPDTPIEDAADALVLPGLVEGHTHIDKSLLGMGYRPHDAGPGLLDKIDNERMLKGKLDIDPSRQSARQAALSSSKGSTHIRSHVDVDTDNGLRGIEGVMATRDTWRDVIDIELVAFPQSGLLRRPGTLELMDAALAAGAEIVGGIDPCGIDRDPKGHLDAVFALCQKHGKPLDIHLHEPGEMGGFSMDLIFDRTRALGMAGQVVISHAFCLGTADATLANRLIDTIADLDIGIMTTGGAAGPVPAIKRLLERGIRVCSGSDGVRDCWGPYGNADMLERAMLVGMRNNLRRDEDVELAFHLCSQGGADVMRRTDYGLAVGRAADLVAVDGETTFGPKGKVTYAPRSPEEMKRIDELVRTAVGFTQARGDQVSVINVRFDRGDEAPTGGILPNVLNFDKNDMMRGGELIVLVVMAGMVIFFVVRPLLATASGGGAMMPLLAGAAGGALPAPQYDGGGQQGGGQSQHQQSPVIRGAEPDSRIDIARIEGQVKASSVKRVSEFVESHPEESVSILRAWLHEGA